MFLFGRFQKPFSRLGKIGQGSLLLAAIQAMLKLSLRIGIHWGLAVGWLVTPAKEALKEQNFHVGHHSPLHCDTKQSRRRNISPNGNGPGSREEAKNSPEITRRPQPPSFRSGRNFHLRSVNTN